MGTTKTILALCVIYYSIIGSRHLTESQKIDDRLQKMFADLNPSFSKGLGNLNELLDLVMNNEEINGVKTQIQETIRSAESFFKDVDQKSTKQLKQYQNDIDSLTDDISNKEKQLNNHRNQLENLGREQTEWRKRAEDLQMKIEDIGAEIRRANQEIRRAEEEQSRRKRHRAGWIICTIFTAGICGIGLGINEHNIQKLQNSRNGYEASVREHQLLFNTAKTNLHNINVNHKCTSDFVYIEGFRISEDQSMLKEMKEYQPALTSLGVEIKKIHTFLISLSSNVNVMKKKNDVLVDLNPLLTYLDELVKLLENNSRLLTLIGNKEIVAKLKIYI